jgi:hypothetical protein
MPTLAEICSASMSALPPKADIVEQSGYVRFVPIPDIAPAIRSPCRRALEPTLGSSGRELWRS